MKKYSLLFLFLTGCTTSRMQTVTSGAGPKEGVPLGISQGRIVTSQFFGISEDGLGDSIKAIEIALEGKNADDMVNMTIDRTKVCYLPFFLCYVTTTVRGVLVKYSEFKK